MVFFFFFSLMIETLLLHNTTLREGKNNTHLQMPGSENKWITVSGSRID